MCEDAERCIGQYMELDLKGVKGVKSRAGERCEIKRVCLIGTVAVTGACA